MRWFHPPASNLRFVKPISFICSPIYSKTVSSRKKIRLSKSSELLCSKFWSLWRRTQSCWCQTQKILWRRFCRWLSRKLSRSLQTLDSNLWKPLLISLLNTFAMTRSITARKITIPPNASTSLSWKNFSLITDWFCQMLIPCPSLGSNYSPL